MHSELFRLKLTVSKKFVVSNSLLMCVSVTCAKDSRSTITKLDNPPDIYSLLHSYKISAQYDRATNCFCA